MDRFGLVGISHRRASVEEIGWFARKPGSLAMLREALGVDELFHVVTCNRVELYWVSNERRSAEQVLGDYAAWLFPGDEARQEIAYSACYGLNGDAVHRHLNSVVCGLDSMVLGDDQIVGQVKRALVESREQEVCGAWLGMLGDEALKLARRVRAQVDYEQRATSVSEVAALLLREEVRERGGAKVALLGAGETIRILAPRLSGWENAELHFVNRTVDVARGLAEQFGGTYQSLADFQAAPVDFDCLATATAADDPLVTAAQFDLLPTTPVPRLVLDLGVPADTDPALAKRPDVRRFDVLEIGTRAEEGRREAELVTRKVRPFLRDATVRFREKIFRRNLNPIANRLRESVHARAQHEADKWLSGPMAHLPLEEQELVRQLVDRLAEQTVQVPLVALRKTLRELPLGELLLERMRQEGRRAAGIAQG